MSILVLQARGARAIDNCGFEDTEKAREALVAGRVDLQWEYTGLSWLVNNHQASPIPDARLQYEAVRNTDAGAGLTWLEPSAFSNTYSLAARASTLDRLGLRTISDLARVSASNPGALTVCAEPKFATRKDGLPGMLRAYNFIANPTVINHNNIKFAYQAASGGGQCTFSEAYTTDGRLPNLGLRTLIDDKHFFPYYNAAPVFRTETLKLDPSVQDTFVKIASHLNDGEMLSLNSQISNQRRDPLIVSKEWLQSKHLL